MDLVELRLQVSACVESGEVVRVRIRAVAGVQHVRREELREPAHPELVALRGGVRVRVQACSATRVSQVRVGHTMASSRLG